LILFVLGKSNWRANLDTREEHGRSAKNGLIRNAILAKTCRNIHGKRKGKKT
jgi:hypothetical protein